MSICLPQQCLAFVYGLPPLGYPWLRETLGWWVRLKSVGHRYKTCSQTLHMTIRPSSVSKKGAIPNHSHGHSCGEE